MFSKTVCVTEPEKVKYPVIKTCVNATQKTRTVVAFNSPISGMVIYTDSLLYKVGEYRTDWSESHFAVCNDIVILCNDSEKVENVDVREKLP